jgi:uncharacterized protein YecE (DUF72 family)
MPDDPAPITQTRFVTHPRLTSGYAEDVAFRIGTSGWQYKDWRGVLYPERLPQRAWLEAYAQEFDTVEVNAAFYRLPKRETFERWRDTVPAGFTMAVKASRYLTHIRRLQDPQEPVARLMEAARGLGAALGPVLLQLPPTLRCEVERLDACLAEFPPDVRVAVEPRHVSWWTDEVAAVLRDRGATLCWADRGSRPITPLWRTADWGYLRLHHGRTGWGYGRTALHSWTERLAETWAPHEDVFVYFNNDPGGAAVRDARTFSRMLVPA